jgi:hypothetical protein
MTIALIILGIYLLIGVVSLVWILREQRHDTNSLEEEDDVEATFAQRKYLADLRTRLGWSLVGIHTMDMQECSKRIREAKDALDRNERAGARLLRRDEDEGEL